MVSFIIGAKQGGNEIADHASSIDTLIGVERDGTTREISFNPQSSNPGQETLTFIAKNFPETRAIITHLMQGPLNSKIDVIQEQGSIEELIEKYKQIYSSPKEEPEQKFEEQYNVPKRDASGKGTRANMGRNPECEPEDYKETGQGSGTEYGRAAESKPQKKAGNPNENNIDELVNKHTNAKTDKEKEKAAEATEKYIKEASKKNLKGKEAEAYVANKLKKNDYNDSNSEESSESSGESKSE